VQLSPLLGARRPVPVDALEHDLGPAGAAVRSFALARGQAGAIATVRLR
jgi:hypothetical protein